MVKLVWTDYPDGNLHKVAITDYDGDKYVTTNEGEIKSGYIYRNRRKVIFKHKTLCRWFNKEE